MAIESARVWRALPGSALERVTRPSGATVWRTSVRRPACVRRTHTRSSPPPRSTSRQSERPDPRRSWLGCHCSAVRTLRTSSCPSWRSRARRMSSGPPASTGSRRDVWETAGGAATATAKAPPTATTASGGRRLPTRARAAVVPACPRPRSTGALGRVRRANSTQTRTGTRYPRAAGLAKRVCRTAVVNGSLHRGHGVSGGWEHQGMASTLWRGPGAVGADR